MIAMPRAQRLVLRSGIGSIQERGLGDLTDCLISRLRSQLAQE
jgi:hypothetical protein